MVRVLQDLTPEEQKEALNCFTKCLSSEEELQDLEQSKRPKEEEGREREGRVGRQSTLMGLGSSLPSPGPRCLRSSAPGSYR